MDINPYFAATCALRDLVEHDTAEDIREGVPPCLELQRAREALEVIDGTKPAPGPEAGARLRAWPAWRAPRHHPPDSVILVTLRDESGTDYVELAEFRARDQRWQLVGGVPLTGELVAWMPTPKPCEGLED